MLTLDLPFAPFCRDGDGRRAIFDHEGKMHHPELDSQVVRRRRAPVHTEGVRIYEPNIATVKV